MSIASVISLSHRVISGQQSQQFTPAMLTNALSVYNEAFNACNASNRACFVCSTPGDIDASDVSETPVVVAAEGDTIFYLFLAYFVILLLFFAIVIATRTRGYRRK